MTQNLVSLKRIVTTRTVETGPLTCQSRLPHPRTDHVGLTKIAKKSLVVQTTSPTPNWGLNADLFASYNLTVELMTTL